MNLRSIVCLCCLPVCAIVVGCGAGGSILSSPSPEVTSGYRQINLVSNTAGTAARLDPAFTNPWGLAFGPGQPFWIAGSSRGTAQVYDSSGAPATPAVISIPATVGSTAPAQPTSIVFNPVPQDFNVQGNAAQFIFATADGTVATWSLDARGDIPTSATLVVINNGANSIYTGIEIPTPACCREYLALADFHNGIIATRDTGFDPLATIGNFTDPNLPVGYAPYNIQQIGQQLFVTYALRDATGTTPVSGAGNGIVNVFDQEGVFLRRFASNGSLNVPWGITQASSKFGEFSNAILIGNSGDGAINAFNASTGASLGQIHDTSGSPILNPGLKGLAFRADGGGDPDTLYLSAAPNQGRDGVFGAITSQP